MILDALNTFSDGQAITASARSTNWIDLGAALRDIGVGENLYIIVVCTVAMTDASSDSTVTVTVETDDDPAFGSATTAVQTIGTFPATSAAGTRLVARIQPLKILEKYMSLYYTVAGGNLSTGSFDAYIAHDIDAARSYPNGSNIS